MLLHKICYNWIYPLPIFHSVDCVLNLHDLVVFKCLLHSRCFSSKLLHKSRLGFGYHIYSGGFLLSSLAGMNRSSWKFNFYVLLPSWKRRVVVASALRLPDVPNFKDALNLISFDKFYKLFHSHLFTKPLAANAVNVCL